MSRKVFCSGTLLIICLLVKIALTSINWSKVEDRIQNQAEMFRKCNRFVAYFVIMSSIKHYLNSHVDDLGRFTKEADLPLSGALSKEDRMKMAGILKENIFRKGNKLY